MGIAFVETFVSCPLDSINERIISADPFPSSIPRGRVAPPIESPRRGNMSQLRRHDCIGVQHDSAFVGAIL